MLYVSNDNEVQTRGIILRCLFEGKRVAVPSLGVNRKEITPSVITDMSELSEGVFGIKEPGHEHIRPFPPELIKTVIVPGIAFDRKGGRIGFGGGYYDRFLRKVSRDAHIWGLAFGFQVMESLPVDSGDVPVQKVITEAGVIDCPGQSAQFRNSSENS